MKRHYWLAISLIVVAAFLAIEGYFAYLGWWALQVISSVEGDVAYREEVERIKSLQPLIYAVAFEALIFGTSAVALAIGVMLRKEWVRAGLLAASFGLAAAVIAIVALWPSLWDRQGFYLLCCACYWWEFYGRGNRAAL